MSVVLAVQHQSRIVLHSIACAAACAIPVPFLDEWVQRRIGKNMLQGILEHYQAPIEPAATVLTNRQGGCLGCLIGVVVYPIAKFIRTIAYFLTIKKVLTECEHWLRRGIVIDIALQMGIRLDTEEGARQLNSIIEGKSTISDTVLLSGIHHIFTGATKDLFQVARGTVRWAKGMGTLEEIVPVELVQAISDLVTPEYIEKIERVLSQAKQDKVLVYHQE